MQATSPKARKVSVKKSTLAGLLAFGAGNMFPQNLLNVVSDSVTAGACLSVKAEFIEGNGFRDTVLSRMVVHRSGLTLDSVLKQVAYNVAYFEAIVLHVGYNALGQIAFIRPIPAEFIRLCIPDDDGVVTHAAVVPYLDDDYNKAKKNRFTTLPLFNPDPEVVQAQILAAGGIANYEGQILYEPFWTPGDGYYHIPSWFPGIRAIESEGKLELYDWRTITSGFNLSGIFTVLGKPLEEGKSYDPMSDPNSIEYQLSEHQGADNAASILVLRTENADELKSTQFFDTTGANLADRYNSTVGRVEQRITRACRVPNELVNLRRSGGLAPTGDEIRVSSQLMQQSVNRYQRKIAEVFTYILLHWWKPVVLDPMEPCKIENLNYFPEDGKVTTAEKEVAPTPKEAKPTTENVA